MRLEAARRWIHTLSLALLAISALMLVVRPSPVAAAAGGVECSPLNSGTVGGDRRIAEAGAALLAGGARGLFGVEINGWSFVCGWGGSGGGERAGEIRLPGRDPEEDTNPFDGLR